MRDPFYEMVYHRKDFTLADALRPQPGWGRRRFTVSASLLGDHTEQEALAAANEPDSVPPGYRLTRLALFPADGPERVIWSTAPVSGARQPVPAAATKEPQQ